MTILNSIALTQNWTFTENGADCHRTSGSALLDCFAICGAMRNRTDSEIETVFQKAIIENPLLALRLAFYTRDIRGGLGERRTGRIMFQVLAKHYANMLIPNLPFIAEFGRWDDLIYLLCTPVEAEVISLLSAQLEEDCSHMLEGKPVSLLAKWLPSVNASSRKTRRQAKKLASAFGMSEKQYRKVMSQLRAYINVTERNLSMSAMDYIRYDAVPSYAMKKYRKAFRRNDEERFSSYLEAVASGKSSIHGEVLYPYDIVEQVLYGIDSNNPVLEAQWKALPDLVKGDQRFLIMADVSGSMYGRPMATSIGLALYFAERNTGLFHNRFMTFSARPELVEVKGKTLYEKIKWIENAHWDMNTDLEAAFELVLQSAVEHQIPQEELPTSIVVITDMEIDVCTSIKRHDFTSEMNQRFSEAGYVMPNLVFWNVDARNNTFHCLLNAGSVQLVSGQSVQVFKNLMNGVSMTPYEYMVSVLQDKRYDCIVYPEN